MLRNLQTHTQVHVPGAPPPLHTHAYHPGLPDHPTATGRAHLYGQGGLMGGAVTLSARGPVGSRRGNTGYGYLGMDPSDPSTWVDYERGIYRPFNPQPGMIAWLNWQSQ